jgi:hypothetical protein
MADKITVLTDAEEEMLNQIDPRAFTVKLGSKIKEIQEIINELHENE